LDFAFAITSLSFEFVSGFEPSFAAIAISLPILVNIFPLWASIYLF